MVTKLAVHLPGSATSLNRVLPLQTVGCTPGEKPIGPLEGPLGKPKAGGRECGGIDGQGGDDITCSGESEDCTTDA